MFKKMRDKIDSATRQAMAQSEQNFQRHAARFQQEAAAQGHDIRPQLPTLSMVSHAVGAMNDDPAMAEFLALPAEEQLRQQREANAYGQNLLRLHELGEPAIVVIRTLEPTGVTVAGQRQVHLGARRHPRGRHHLPGHDHTPRAHHGVLAVHAGHQARGQGRSR